jgi:hypothetical protein
MQGHGKPHSGNGQRAQVVLRAWRRANKAGPALWALPQFCPDFFKPPLRSANLTRESLAKVILPCHHAITACVQAQAQE